MSTSDEIFMRECFRLAAKGAGRVSPNPMVGAVLVKGGRIVARGYHRRFGAAHAEVGCLQNFGNNPRGLTMYVNLEPCAHHGKTPPCTDLIIRSGIKRVVVGMKDPNPLVSGGGITALKRAGIQIKVGLLREEAEALNKFFVAHIRRGWPYILLKVAQTLDGFFAEKSRRPLRISGAASEELVHRWRSEYDAVLVGAGTIIADDPRLTVRKVKGRNPDVVILDARLRINPASRVFSAGKKRRVFLCTSDRAMRRNAGRANNLQSRGANILTFKAPGGRIPIKKIMMELYRQNIGSVLVEGGGEVFSQFVENNLADEISVFVALRLLGKGVRAFPEGKNDVVARWEPKNVTAVGEDLLLQY